MLNPKLILKTDNGDYSYELKEGQILFAGRTAECDICLPTPSVSRRHAILMMRGGKCGLKDMGSGNGTYLNGKKLDGPVKLRDGDTIQIATHRLIFVAPPKIDRFQNAAETLVLPSDILLKQMNSNAFPERGQQPAAGPMQKPVEPPVPASAMQSEPEKARSSGTEAMSNPIEESGDRDTAPASVVPQSQRRKIDASTVRKVRESIRMTPKAPPVPKVQSHASEDEFGDGSGDSGLHDIVAQDKAQERDNINLSLTKKAADAGLVGEFAPEPPELHDMMDVKAALDADAESGIASGAEVEAEEGSQESDTPELQDAEFMEEGGHTDMWGKPVKIALEALDDEQDEPDPKPPSEQSSPSLPEIPIPNTEASIANDLLPLPPGEANPDAAPISDEFRHAIESRLFYYSFMEDLRSEREQVLAINPDAADSVKSEIDRQNREMAKPPRAEQALDRIEKINARREALREKIREAKKEGKALPPRPSKLMREVEDIGINQWTIIAQSLRESLPAACIAGYEVVKDEPLAKTLEEVKIDAKTLMGGSVYCLALEILLEEAKFNREVVKGKLSEMTPPDEKKGGGGFLSKISRNRNRDEDEDSGEGEEGDSYEGLQEIDHQLGLRNNWITQEMAFAEDMLIKEFWNVYLQAALRFIPKHREMDMCVRAFLRHGVIGFSRWWLKKPVRDFVVEDCTNEVRHDFEVGEKITNVVYADEYLAAVMEERCTPAMDENLEINEKNSPNWKADKALRRLISTRAQMARTKELLDSLQSRIDKNDQNGAALDERIKKLLPGSKNFRQAKQELSQERQAIRIEVSKLNKLAKKLKESLEGELQEAITDTEERFSSGELPRPTPEFLIEREVGQIRRIGRLTANLKERLLPLAMREYQIDTDAANDRLSIVGELSDVERRDPRIFLETIVPSKKRANRVDMRVSPVVVLLPSAGVLAFSWNPRQKPEDGRLGLPTFFIRQRIRERQIAYLMSDFRWDTAKASAGMDLMNSETIVAEFMRVRWDWRKRSKEMREKGLVYTEQNDRTNWRRVYEAYLTTAYDGGKKLFNRNYDFYERIVGKYFDMPEGVELLRK